jgi:hypothetical protein
MRKSSYLVIAFVVISIITAFYYLQTNQKKHLEKALAAFQNGDIEKAEIYLGTLPCDAKMAFAKGCLELARGNHKHAASFFKAASRGAKEKRDNTLLAETFMAQAMHAFLNDNEKIALDLIESARLLNSRTHSLIFFEGLKHYLHKEYAEALKFWTSFAPCEKEWIAGAISWIFPQSWRELRIALCCIETGDLNKGREILEKESQSSSLATLLLGLSYLKEAREIASPLKGSYYRLANFYFANVKDPQLIKEQDLVVQNLEEEAKKLFFSPCDQEKIAWGTSLIQTLNDWKAERELDSLAQYLSQKCIEEKGLGIMFCRQLRQELEDSKFYHLLLNTFTQTFASHLKSGNLEEMEKLWTIIEEATSEPRLIARQLSAWTAQELFEIIRKDDFLLSRTHNFISFWEKVERTEFEKQQLAANLVCHAKLFWHNEQEEKKGEQLMELALHLSNYSLTIEKEITSFLTTLYAQAENSNMIRRLTLIYDAMERFGIGCLEAASKAVIANHLADAEYLYQTHNYLGAKLHACWILKMDPANEKARHLASLSSSYLGECPLSFNERGDRDDLDEDACKSLMLSQAFSSEENEGFCHLSAPQTFEEKNPL